MKNLSRALALLLALLLSAAAFAEIADVTEPEPAALRSEAAEKFTGAEAEEPVPEESAAPAPDEAAAESGDGAEMPVAEDVKRTADDALAASGDEDEEEDESGFAVYYPAKLSMSVGEQTRPKASSAADKKFSYSSSNAKVASVNSKGKITAKAPGTAVITALGKTSRRSASCKVTVKVAPEKLTLNRTAATCDLDDELELRATIAPSAAAQKVKWKSSNEEVATVEDGYVSCLAEGTATITATAVKRNAAGKPVRASCKLTVVDPEKPASLEFEKEGPLKVFVDDTLTLDYVLKPKTAESEILWKSSDERIATVEDGEVTGLREGTVTIRATTESEASNGKRLHAKIVVLVVDPYKPSGITLIYEGKAPLILSLDDSLSLDYELTPEDAESDVRWESSNPKIASVEDGEVEPKRPGVVKITATTRKKGRNGKRLSASVKLIVFDPALPVSVELDEEGTVTLPKGEELELFATILPETAEDAELKWTSSNKAVAKVSQDGVVTGLKKGVATITVRTQNGKRDSVRVRVTP